MNVVCVLFASLFAFSHGFLWKEAYPEDIHVFFVCVFLNNECLVNGTLYILCVMEDGTYH